MALGRDLLGRDLYGVLEVSPAATPATIRQAYRRLVRGSHPDLHPLGTEQRMVDLNLAASVLLDPARRAEYDQFRRAAKAGRPKPVAPCGGYPWSTAAGHASSEWVRPPSRGRRPADDRDVTRLLERLRVGPARTLHSVASQTAEWSPRTHACVTLVSVFLSFLLVAAARPRSLPGFHDRQGERHAMHQPQRW